MAILRTPHRFLIIVPAARQAAMNTFIKNNIDPDGGDWFDVPLNVAGDDSPPTHYWCSAALTNLQVRRMLARLCNLASITFPATWDDMTRMQQLAWLAGNRGAIRTALGIWIVRSDQDGRWDDPEDALTELMIKRRRASNTP